MLQPHKLSQALDKAEDDKREFKHNVIQRFTELQVEDLTPINCLERV